MFTLISVLILIVCLLLVLVVLVQNSKGGGLSANFTGSNQVMGVRRTADFLEKATWTLASILLTLSILASWAIKKPDVEVKTRIEQNNVTTTDQPLGLPLDLDDNEE
ncbi:MAG: preprotein translocase subunit SecG [Bacteroidales bacterium]|nr:preprotein translocase subunit SecG [Bacteroidales bacterium]